MPSSNIHMPIHIGDAINRPEDMAQLWKCKQNIKKINNICFRKTKQPNGNLREERGISTPSAI